MSYFDQIKNTEIKENAVIMGIETSCDETAVAIVKGGREIIAEKIISSATEHARFGGVVPEIASRSHTKAILTATQEALKEANMTMDDIDAIAVTKGAGLLGALLVGVSFAKALAFSCNKPLVPVSHIRGHISASYLADKELKPPFITILASGGHTAIVKVEDYYNLKILGSTIDDAKSGKNVIKLPKMLAHYDGGEYDFSYSGLKTAVINYVHNTSERGEEIVKEDVACSFQCSAIDVLIEKALKAVDETGYKTVCLSGGVGANGYLRERLQEEAKKRGLKTVIPEKKYCTDNASMIASEGYLQYKAKNFADLTLNAQAVIPFK